MRKHITTFYEDIKDRCIHVDENVMRQRYFKKVV